MYEEEIKVLSEAETEKLCNESDAENQKLKAEIDELKNTIQKLTKKNERLQRSLKDRQLSERSYKYLKESYTRYIESAESAVIHLSERLEKAEEYVRNVNSKCMSIANNSRRVSKSLDKLFYDTNEMFNALSFFGIKNPNCHWCEPESDFLNRNVKVKENDSAREKTDEQKSESFTSANESVSEEVTVKESDEDEDGYDSYCEEDLEIIEDDTPEEPKEGEEK